MSSCRLCLCLGGKDGSDQTVSSKGEITGPMRACKRLGVKKGDSVKKLVDSRDFPDLQLFPEPEQ